MKPRLQPPPRLHGFAPVATARARVLILGSMPGKASLAAEQYYAHPQNQFWRILGELAGAGRELPYPERLHRLQAAGIALWDVLASCTRPGSLDADICPASMMANDFGPFFAAHPGLRRICFNGATAEALFRRRVLPGLPLPPGCTVRRLPSTSPAHAALPYARKLELWRDALAPFSARYRASPGAPPNHPPAAAPPQLPAPPRQEPAGGRGSRPGRRRGAPVRGR